MRLMRASTLGLLQKQQQQPSRGQRQERDVNIKIGLQVGSVFDG